VNYINIPSFESILNLELHINNTQFHHNYDGGRLVHDVMYSGVVDNNAKLIPISLTILVVLFIYQPLTFANNTTNNGAAVYVHENKYRGFQCNYLQTLFTTKTEGL